MRKVLAIAALALSGCALPSQQSATPTTPEQLAAMTAYNAEIDQANAERERERIAEEAIQVQHIQSVQQNIHPLQPFSPTIKVMPVNQFGQPLY
jgi:hypothetical protein